jgi:hypothetical protein
MSMTEQTKETLNIAEWVDATLNETLTETLSHHATRVFAVYKSGAAYDRVLVDTDADPYRLLTRLPDMPADHPGVPLALCLVMTGWMTKVADANDEGDFNEIDEDEQERIRVRVCAAVNDDGCSTVVRRFGPNGTADSFSDGGEGIFPEALTVWWAAVAASN